MESVFAQLRQAVPATRLLGWLNFSDGRPEPKWQRQLDDAFAIAQRGPSDRPWMVLRSWLDAEIASLEAGESAAFRDVHQARAVIELIFDHVIPAYRRHHADLLAHLSDAELFTGFFVARIAEAILALGGPWNETERIVRGVLLKLNDYVGHRPVAVLEGRATEVYSHEKVRPVPLFIRGAGTAHGKYAEIVTLALDLLAKADHELLLEACYEPALLDELAFDPRPVDHGHPVNRRPNYLFGEWDPHHLDNQGRFRRFVVRKNTLDDIMSRVPLKSGGKVSREEMVFEAGAVLAGTILMAAGTSGSGPSSFDSNVTLSKLVPRIARYRDAFYKRLIAEMTGPHGERLRQEAKRLRQPFGAARQHVNQVLARQRATELQESHLALLFAEMGYAEASRRRAATISAVSVRMLSEIRLRLTSGHFAVEKGDVTSAAVLLEESEDLLHRGIECGALADPWNAIGFQGLFPLFTSREDSVRDTRLDDLVDVMSRLFHLYSAALAASASADQTELQQRLSRRMTKLAEWWDRHAVYEVSDLPRVHGMERAASAGHVASALAGVRSSSDSASDLAYWRRHRDGFRAPSGFAQVLDALLRQRDYRSSLALLMTWLSEASSVPLEEGDDSFHTLATRWLRDVTDPGASPEERVPLVARFFVQLEANADDFWGVPEWAFGAEPRGRRDEAVEAAYEEMTYRDSTDDDEEGSVAGGSRTEYFPLEDEAERLEGRLQFLGTVAQLWQAAVPYLRPHLAARPELVEALTEWQRTAHFWLPHLFELLDRVHELKVPEPSGGFEDVMEYDRRRMLREQLAEGVIETALEIGRASRLLTSATGIEGMSEDDSPWETAASELEAELGRGDPAAVRRVLPKFLAEFRHQPLLFVPMSAGGHPRQILRSRQAQTMLRSLLERLPRLGLIRETYHLTQLARTMEQNAPPAGRKISEFDHLFPIALQSVLDALLDAAHSWPDDDLEGDDALVELLRRITDSFLSLWLAHSQTLRLSVMESPPIGADWDDLRDFIRKYGSDLFTPQFLAMANLRSITHRSVENWLEAQIGQPDTPRLIDAIDSGTITLSQASSFLEFLCHALIEHHEEYRDYNSTTTQSDYGENLHLLLDFLKLKTNYDRYAWRMRPLVQAHAVLCRRGEDDAAVRWRDRMGEFTRGIAEPLLEELTKLEQETGLRLRTVRDRLEERFVRPLVIDRLSAWVEPAMHEAPDPPAEGGAFAKMEKQLEALTRQPTGIGLDVPEWLERLEDEAERIRQLRMSGEEPPLSGLAPGVSLTFEDLEQQLADWDKPI